jgi:polyhydroxybutyrate depolymerase
VTQPSVERLDVTVNGTARTALVHVPATAAGTEPWPVVLSFHGGGSTAGDQQAIDGLTDKSDEEGFVVVHPEGLVVDLNDQVTDVTGWDVAGREVDEPAFVSALLDELAAQVCIDPSRVYATGFSNGGQLALSLPCSLEDRIVAVAPVAGAYQSTECESDRATPVMAFHGTDDIVAPADGRRGELVLLPVADVLAAQAARNGCTGGPRIREETPTVQSLTWTGCETPTVLYLLQGHGHAWPGHPLPFTLGQVESYLDTEPPNPIADATGLTLEAMAENILLTNVDIDATDLMWDFFTQSR